MKSVSYLGIDVDTKAFSIAIFSPETNQISEHKIRPKPEALIELIRKLPTKVRICYEAGYLSYSLARTLRNAGYHCDVVAPSLVPSFSGSRVKTDRLDAAKLARYYGTQLLTTVHIPDEDDEAVRGLVRSRQFTVGQLTQIKNRINGLCRAQGWDYKTEKNQKSYWTTLHHQWLEQKVLEANPVVGLNLKLMLAQHKQTKEFIAQFEEAILRVSQEESYAEKVKALTAYRSINVMTAMSIISELGDIARFARPRQITSYVGLDISEYSSGGTHHRFKITRLGNAYLRYAIVESTQYALFKPNISKSLKKRREGVNPNYVDIADRCMDRLYKKGSRLLYAGKHKNKVKIAQARELIGFIWESLREAQNLKTSKLITGTVQLKKPTRQPTIGTISGE